MDRRLQPIVGAVAFAGAFLTGILTAGNASAAVRSPSAGGGSERKAHLTSSARLHPDDAPRSRSARRHLTPARVEGPQCDESQPRGEDTDYPGLSVSALYDRLFSSDAAIPNLGSHVPQALRTWYDWDGQGNDLLLLGEYREGEESYLVGIDPDSREVLGTVRVAGSHLGGMAFLGQWLFTGDNPWPNPGSPTVTPYRISALRAAMAQAIETGEMPYLRSDGPRQDVHSTDFMTTDGDSIYAGNHGNPIPGLMYRYELGDDGQLVPVEGPVKVPPRAQGLVVTPDAFVFSADNGRFRGQLDVVDRDAPQHVLACVWTPSMPEGIDTYRGRLVMASESGAAKYARARPVNRIRHLQSAPTTKLLALTDPAAGSVLHTAPEQ